MSNNRLWNCKNPAQGDFKKVLCVSSAGLLRSPTIAWVLSNEPFNFNTRAVGSSFSFALTPIDDMFIEWADIVVFVNSETAKEVEYRFDLTYKHVITLELPDVFKFRDPRLVEIAKKQLAEAFEEMDKQLSMQKRLDK